MNPILKMMQKNAAMTSQTNLMGNNPNSIMKQLGMVKSMLNGKDPKTVVDELVSSGKMSQEQLQQYEKQAESIMSIFK